MAERKVLHSPDGAASVEVDPTLGALVTRLSLGGRDVLYLDEASLADPKASKRGGIPVLFPSPGRLKADLFEAEGRYGSLKNHGFARDLPFAIVDESSSSLALRLEATDDTLSHYPWNFVLDLRLSIAARLLTYDVAIENKDEETMPCGFGLHPYFAVADKAKARVKTGATRAWDNRTKRHVDLPPAIDFTQGEIDLHLVDHWTHTLDLDTGEGIVRVGASDAFRTWVLWTLPERPFVCVEPWTSPADALNTKKDLMLLSPGERRELRVTIEIPEASSS